MKRTLLGLTLAVITAVVMLFHYSTAFKAVILNKIHVYSFKLSNITKPKEETGNTLTFYGNDFILHLDKLKAITNANQTAGILMRSKSQLEVFAQNESKKILAQYKIDLQGRTLEETISKNGGVKRIFKFDNSLIGLFTLFDKKSNCYHVSLFNLTAGVEFMRGECLPEISGIDFNGIGGGHAELKGKLLVAIGTPTTDYPKISSLAQNSNSHYGKILEFSKEETYLSFKNFRQPNIFSFGHRNPQGLINLGNKIFSVEHGPKGGDEINLLERGGNYGWPLYSFGSKYEGSAYRVSDSITRSILPIYSFIPSIGISNIALCPKSLVRRYAPTDCLLVSSLRGNSIYIVLLNPKSHSVISVQQINVGMRVREFYRDHSDGTLYISTDQLGTYQLSFKDVANFFD